MSFEVGRGSYGARQPGGRLLALVNRWTVRRIRRRNPGRGGPSKELVLTTVGRRTGARRESPVNYFADDGSWLIVASAGGAVAHPAWFHNLSANPDDIRIELDGRSIGVRAQLLGGSERDRAWQQITATAPRFATYQRRTDRELPVIRLTERQD